jgi:adenine-specific DNA glycosylase
MPVFGYEMKTVIENENGHDVLREVPVVQSNSATIRQCDTCFVAANCPAFQPATTCAFSLPVEVKSKEQLKALLTSIVEMQGQRVAFMRYAEELNGGYADPNTSQEMDRLLKLVSTVKDLETNKEVITMTASRQTSGGILSSIFGDRATELKEMKRPISEEQTTYIIKDSLEG